MSEDGPIIKFPDGGSVKVVDPDNIAPVYVDLITEFREVDGVVYISLGSYIIDSDNGGQKARVVARLRVSNARAATLYGLLGNLLAPKGPDAPKEALN